MGVMSRQYQVRCFSVLGHQTTLFECIEKGDIELILFQLSCNSKCASLRGGIVVLCRTLVLYAILLSYTDSCCDASALLCGV